MTRGFSNEGPYSGLGAQPGKPDLHADMYKVQAKYRTREEWIAMGSVRRGFKETIPSKHLKGVTIWH